MGVKLISPVGEVLLRYLDSYLFEGLLSSVRIRVLWGFDECSLGFYDNSTQVIYISYLRFHKYKKSKAVLNHLFCVILYEICHCFQYLCFGSIGKKYGRIFNAITEIIASRFIGVKIDYGVSSQKAESQIKPLTTFKRNGEMHFESIYRKYCLKKPELLFYPKKVELQFFPEKMPRIFLNSKKIQAAVNRDYNAFKKRGGVRKGAGDDEWVM